MASSANPTFDSSRWKQRVVPITTSIGESIRINYVECPAATSHPTTGNILLIHGFPQTSYQFRHVITPLADRGFRIIAPDYRGAGPSSKTITGYDKMQMAEDLHILIQDHLKIKERVHVVGHDIGGMIAWAYAAQYPQDVASVIWGECPLPGTSFYEEKKGTPDLFHFVFHSIPDLPEALIAGKERVYLTHFYHKLAVNSGFLTLHDIDFYVHAFQEAGAMRAGLEVYRAFEQDAENNRNWIQKNGKIKVPTLGLYGDGFMLGDAAGSMLKEMHVEGTADTLVIEDCGHWIAEEKPKEFVEAVVNFVSRY